MSEKFTGHGIVGPMIWPGPAAPEPLSAKKFGHNRENITEGSRLFVDFTIGNERKGHKIAKNEQKC